VGETEFLKGKMKIKSGLGFMIRLTLLAWQILMSSLRQRINSRCRPGTWIVQALREGY